MTFLQLATPVDYDADDIRDLTARLADTTAIAEMFQRRADRLATALDSNRQIGVAIGLIMAQYKLDHQAAFDVLVRLSQNSNCRVRDLAVDIITVEDPAYQPPARIRSAPKGSTAENETVACG